MTNLVLALLDTSRPLSLREIGTLVSGYPHEQGALRQAFERDKRTLRDGGIPISVERVGGDDQVGYRILPESYYLADLGLDEDEERALTLARASVRLEGSSARDVASKLGATRALLPPPVVVLPSLPALGVLQDAIRRRGAASFSYRGRVRSVEGYGLVFREGSWYFIGRDDRASSSGAVRTFRVDRIEGVPSIGAEHSYDVPAGFDAPSQLRFAPFVGSPNDQGETAFENGTTKVVINVDVREANRALSLFGDGSLEERNADGSIRLRFPIGDHEAFCSWVLGLGDAIEVCSPQELRDTVIARLLAALEDDAGRAKPPARKKR
jgi:proteasome accessory factor B/proteasome accessory factor C